MIDDDELRAWGESRRLPPPTLDEAAALVRRAQRSRWRWLWLLAPVVPAGLALAALALLVAIGLYRTAPAPDPAPPPLVLIPPVPVPDPVVLETGSHAVGDDQLEVDGEVAVTVEADRARIELRAGSVTVQAAPRAPGRSLVVEADGHEVHVVGTRFTVVRSPFDVSVEHGVVEVVRGAEVVRLGAGERLRPRSERPVRRFDLAAARAKILSGAADEARVELVDHLARDPGDTDAWSLLALLERRAGRVAEAVAAWREVVARGSVDEAQRARFEAATLLAGAPAEAIPLWEAFLERPDPLAAEARLRLGQARAAAGDREGARREWERILLDHPGSGPADAARALLAR
jgi:hypothetical protein